MSSLVWPHTLLYNYTSFTDVSVNNRYYEYIAAGESLGITTGDDKGCFNPDSYISRQDAAVLIGRAYKIPINQAFDILRYRDGIDISSYAVGYMSYMTNKKILNGFEDNTIQFALGTMFQRHKLWQWFAE